MKHPAHHAGLALRNLLPRALRAAMAAIGAVLAPWLLLGLLLSLLAASPAARAQAASCPAQTIGWSGQGVACGAAVTAASPGASIGVVSTNGESGTAWLSCQAGRWVVQSGFCASKRPPAPVGEVAESQLFAVYTCAGARSQSGPCASLEVMCSREAPRAGAYPVLVHLEGVPSAPGNVLAEAQMRSALLACYRAVNGFEIDWEFVVEDLTRGSLGIQANAQRAPQNNGAPANRWDWARGLN